MPVRRLVIDVLIPHNLSILHLAEKMAEVEGVDGANVHVLEVDEKTKTVEMTIDGGSLSFDAIKEVTEELGGSVHSVDMVSAGAKLIEPEAAEQEP